MPEAKPQQKSEEKEKRTQKEDHFRHQTNLFLLHEFQAARDIVHREDDKDMQQHIQKAVRLLLPVDNVVVEDSVCKKQTHHNEERHQGEIGASYGKGPLKVRGDADNHFPESKNDIEHRSLGQMRKIHVTAAVLLA